MTSPLDDHTKAVLRHVGEEMPRPTREASESAKERTLRAYRQRATRVDWAAVDSPLGRIHLAAGPQGLHRVEFDVQERAFLELLDPRAQLERDGPNALPAVRALKAYFSNEPRTFELSVDLREMTEFQQRVLHWIRSIPPGRMVTYGQVAEGIGKDGAARAVGQALGANPIPIVIPCHRVIASDGSLGGYSGGLHIKEFLLQHEGAR